MYKCILKHTTILPAEISQELLSFLRNYQCGPKCMVKLYYYLFAITSVQNITTKVIIVISQTADKFLICANCW